MDNVNNIYYVCSKRVKFLKRHILDIVIEFFEKKKDRNLLIDDIYIYFHNLAYDYVILRYCLILAGLVVCIMYRNYFINMLKRLRNK